MRRSSKSFVRGLKPTRRSSTPQECAAEIQLLCNRGKLRDALLSFSHRHTYKYLLRCCTALEALEEGQALHALILTSISISIVPLESTLVYMYLQCDCIEDARHIFDRMEKRETFVWNVMIAAYTRYGHGEKAFQIFAAMEKASVPRDEITFVNILKTCKFLGNLDLGRWVHACSITTTSRAYISVENSLLGMYAHYGSLEDAYYVFKQMEFKDVVSWTLLIAGYVIHGYAKEAIVLYLQMESKAIQPDKVTFLSVLQACSSLENLERGREAHCQVVLYGLELEAFMDMQTMARLKMLLSCSESCIATF